MALLEVNGARVFFLKPSADPNHPWVVLCYDPAMTNVQWTVWLADDDGYTVVGGYHSTFDDARDDFDSRVEGTPTSSN